MSQRPIPLNELAIAVQSAVEQTLAKHGAVPIDKIWFGFVAPENLATLEAAATVTNELGKISGVHGQPSVASLGGAAAGQAVHEKAAVRPGHIIGLVYEPKLKQ